MEIKRVAVYIVYDEDGFLDLYRKNFLKEIKKNIDYLIVIINGTLNNSDLTYLFTNADKVFIRDNYGYEMKAYEDLFLKYLPFNFLQDFDELIMCNDSFYGPFIPLKDVFEEMKKSSADYWGINKMCNGFVEYISSYFVVYRSKIINSNELKNYFVDCKDYIINDFIQAVQLFEVGLFYYLKRRGYTSDTYIKGIANNITKYPDYYLEQRGVPFIKRKSFCNQYNDLSATKNALDYLKRKQDISFILNNAYRKYGCEIDDLKITKAENRVNDILLGDSIENRENEIIEFCNRHEEIYIYGAGRCARKVWAAYRYYIKCFKGFIISDNQAMIDRTLWGTPVFYYKELEEPIAMIIAIKKIDGIVIKEHDVFI